MINCLPKLPKAYNFKIKEIRKYLIEQDSFDDDEIVIFLVPTRVVNNKIEIYKYSLFSYVPTFRKFSTIFSQDREASFDKLELCFNEGFSEGYTDIMYGHGSLDSEIVIDGYVSDVTRLHDNGLNISNAFLTNKRDELYYSEKVFDLDINEMINEIILSKSFSSDVNIIELKSYINDLKSLVRYNKIHKQSLEFQTFKLRELFYKKINAEQIEQEKNINMFLTCGSLLNYIGVINFHGRTLAEDKVFDYFKDEEFRESLSMEDYDLTVTFNERFLKIFAK